LLLLEVLAAGHQVLVLDLLLAVELVVIENQL
jgi:hypothetical protein